MTEQDLIDLGFNKVEINNKESGNGYDYYYYGYKIFEDLYLNSTDSDKVTNDDWAVSNIDWPVFKLDTVGGVQMFIKMMSEHSNKI